MAINPKNMKLRDLISFSVGSDKCRVDQPSPVPVTFSGPVFPSTKIDTKSNWPCSRIGFKCGIEIVTVLFSIDFVAPVLCGDSRTSRTFEDLGKAITNRGSLITSEPSLETSRSTWPSEVMGCPSNVRLILLLTLGQTRTSEVCVIS